MKYTQAYFLKNDIREMVSIWVAACFKVYRNGRTRVSAGPQNWQEPRQKWLVWILELSSYIFPWYRVFREFPQENVRDSKAGRLRRPPYVTKTIDNMSEQSPNNSQTVWWGVVCCYILLKSKGFWVKSQVISGAPRQWIKMIWIYSHSFSFVSTKNTGF